MIRQNPSSWELWNSLAISRVPVSLIIHPRLIAERKKTNNFPLSDTAFVHRMFSLLFPLEYQPLRALLTKEEDADLGAFLAQFRKLPWRVIPTHEHISELDDASQLLQIRKAAQRLDIRLERRTSDNLVSIGYRLLKGWPLNPPAPSPAA